MGGSNFRYFVREGLSGLRSHASMTFAAVGITVACLLLTGSFCLVAVNTAGSLAGMEQANEILAFVEETRTPEEARAIEDALLAIPNVAEAQFISRTEAMEDFSDRYLDEDLAGDLAPEIFRDRYALRLTDLDQAGDTMDQVRQVAGVDDVYYYEEVASGVATVQTVAAAVLLGMAFLMFLTSSFIVSNTIRLATYERREEIAIMRMVGATNAFIRWPFVYAGFFMGLVSAVTAFLIEWGLYTLAAHFIHGQDAMRLFEILPFRQLWLPLAGAFLAAGLFIGVGGSLSALRKFLKG